MNYEVEVHRRIYDNDEGHYISVRPSTDFPGNVLLYTEQSERDYFGNIRIDLPAKFMKLLGQAIIDTAGEQEEPK